MKLCRWLVRGLGVACLVLGGILLSVGVVSLTARVAHAQAPTVGSIVVQGNRRVEAETIRSYFRPGPGGRLDAFQIDEGVKALYATGLFQDVRPTFQGGRLIVTVVENPVINRIAFEGNKKVKDEQLKAEIQSKERGTLSRPVVQADVRAWSRSIAAAAASTSASSRRSSSCPNNRVDLVFEITEGAKTGVKSIEFIGNRAYSSYRLKDVIKTSETGLSVLPADQRHLRSGPDRGRPRAAAPLLSQARLHRRAHRLRGRRIRSGSARIRDHLHDRGRRAVPLRHGRRAVERAAARSLAGCDRGCGPIRATSTTPRRSRRPSRT